MLGRGAGQDEVFIPGNTFINSNLTVSGTINANLPSGSGNYIQNNPSTQQPSSSFNISGTGTANAFNANSQYNIIGHRVLSISGDSNVFVGEGAGLSNTTGVC